MPLCHAYSVNNNITLHGGMQLTCFYFLCVCSIPVQYLFVHFYCVCLLLLHLLCEIYCIYYVKLLGHI